MSKYIGRKTTCKDCFHYCVCKDTVADENWEEDAPKEVREMFSPSGCENYKSTTDVVETRHGEWKEETEYYADDYSECNVRKVYACSLCGRMEKRKEPYCHCGARMDRKD